MAKVYIITNGPSKFSSRPTPSNPLGLWCYSTDRAFWFTEWATANAVLQELIDHARVYKDEAFYNKDTLRIEPVDSDKFVRVY